nr:glycosyltransferase [Polycladospora coralii]
MERSVFFVNQSPSLPLVSILIPTYNRPKWFEEALLSAISQSYSNIEIIICDDSTTNETEELVLSYSRTHDHIQYHRNPSRLGQFENDLKLFELSNGVFINYLMDDDLFTPTKIEKMMHYFQSDENQQLSLITSKRDVIDEQGEKQPDIGATQSLFQADTRIPGQAFANFILGYGNGIGEPTTVLFRKSALTVPFGTFANRRYHCDVDMATWLNLLLNGDIIYMAEPLSYFRIHSQQQLHSPPMLIGGAADCLHRILSAYRSGLLQDQEQRHQVAHHYLNYAQHILTQLSHKKEQFPHHLEEIKTYTFYIKDELLNE